MLDLRKGGAIKQMLATPPEPPQGIIYTFGVTLRAKRTGATELAQRPHEDV